MSAYGIDQDDNLWEWGDHKVKNQDGSPPIWEKAAVTVHLDEKRSTPYKWVYFSRNNLKPIMVASGNSWCLLKTEHTETKEIMLYGWSDNSTDGRFGEGCKEISDNFYTLGTSFQHADVMHFACSKEASYLILQKAVTPLPSIIKESPDYHGLVHFYKQGKSWMYIKEEDFGSRQGKIPNLVFATRHPIQAWEQILADEGNTLDLIPDLDKIIVKGIATKANMGFSSVKTTNI